MRKQTSIMMAMLTFVLLISTGSATAAPYWGEFKADDCVADGYRQYSAILWNIPWGQSWSAACYSTPATIHGQYFDGADRCEEVFFHMWGEFDVYDETCIVYPTDWVCYGPVGCQTCYRDVAPGMREVRQPLCSTSDDGSDESLDDQELDMEIRFQDDVPVPPSPVPQI